MRKSNDILFAEAAKEWLEYVTPELKYSSIARYTNILKLHLMPEFAETPISEITRDRVNRYHGKGISAALSASNRSDIFDCL